MCVFVCEFVSFVCVCLCVCVPVFFLFVCVCVCVWCVQLWSVYLCMRVYVHALLIQCALTRTIRMQCNRTLLLTLAYQVQSWCWQIYQSQCLCHKQLEKQTVTAGYLHTYSMCARTVCTCAHTAHILYPYTMHVHTYMHTHTHTVRAYIHSYIETLYCIVYVRILSECTCMNVKYVCNSCILPWCATAAIKC